MRYRNYKNGFTLTELIVSVAISVSLLGVISGIYSNLTKSRQAYKSVSEVEFTGNEAMNILTQAVRNSTSISVPAAGISTSTLNLGLTIFSLNNSAIQMSVSGVNSFITGDQIVISNLSFTNLSWANTSGLVRVQFTASQGNYYRTFYSSATVRKFIQQ